MNKNFYNKILSCVFLALALVLPFFTMQIKELGNALCPMHIPIILCGYFCGPIYGSIIGFISPLLRYFIFGMPQLMPTAIAMCFELATYSLIAGLLYKILPKKNIYIYISLIIAMLSGRIVWGVIRVILLGLGKAKFGFEMFITGAFITAIPGIIIQIVLIPILVITLNRIGKK